MYLAYDSFSVQEYKIWNKFFILVAIIKTFVTLVSFLSRSVPSVLTNGDISPAKTDTVPTSPNLTPLNNWLLSCVTNSPDQAFNTATTLPGVTVDEKPKTQSNEENSVGTNTSSNTTPNSDDKTEQLPITGDVQGSENNEEASKTEENTLDTTNEDIVENCEENGTNEQTINSSENSEVLASNETPTGQ